MKGVRGISLAALALIITSCAQPQPATPESEPPTVTAVKLDYVAGAVEVPLSATVVDNVGVTKVQFYVGATKVGEVDAKGAKSGTYSVNITAPLALSCQQIKVAAYDAAGNTAEATGSTQCP